MFFLWRNPFNPLAAKDEISGPGNLTFLQSWTPRRVATHAPLCNTLPSNNRSPKSVKNPALKGLRRRIQNVVLISFESTFYAEAIRSYGTQTKTHYLGLFRTTRSLGLKSTLTRQQTKNRISSKQFSFGLCRIHKLKH